MNNKKIYGFLLLALIIMLLPTGMVSAKYKQTKEVGKVTLDIEPPILSPNWKEKLTTATTTLIVDSFTPKTEPDRYNFFNWDIDGEPVGYGPNNENDVRLFEDNNGTAYILAIGNNPVTFPENSSFLFQDWSFLYENIQNIKFNNVDTSNVVNMSSMFNGCSNMTSLDISSFNTSNVTDMSYMFAGCNSMTSLDLSSFDTSKVTTMADMFNTCSVLESLDVRNFNTSSVTNMADMFNGCNALINLDLSGFDTSKVTNMSYMFNGCNALISLDLSSFDTSKVTTMADMFNTCSVLESLDLSSFNTSNVANMKYMFSCCTELKTIFVGDKWNTENLKATLSDQYMFFKCTSLVGGNGQHYDPSHIGKDYAMIDAQGTPGYLTYKPSTTSNIFSLVQEGGTIIGTQTTNSEEE